MANQLSAIVGLGNPGASYSETRHNAGFWFVDELARKWGATLKNDRKLLGDTAAVTVCGGKLRLLKPDTFVNRSGESIAALLRYFRLEPAACLVAYDELDLPPGTVRFKLGGGHGGHNGVRDTIRHLGTADFPRLRIGIGHPGHKSAVTGYVLSRPESGQRDAILRGIDAAVGEIEAYVAGDWDKATARLHLATRPAAEQGD